MKKSLMTLAAVLCCALTVMAEPVSPAMARQAAAQFLQQKGVTLKSEAMRAPNRAMGQTADGESAAEASPYYVFNASNDKGFVIVSGDDCVGDNLVLGYTAEGRFDTSAVPANMQGWLDNTAEQIAAMSRLGMKARVVATHDNVAPLVTAQWDQGRNTYDATNPYNAFCPVQNGMLCLTGCMATALSQVLYYYRWPQAPIDGELPAYSTVDGRLIEALPSTTFDWDNMLDSYKQPTTEAQQAAVATLMRYCGQLLQMDYTPSITNGACFDTDILVNQFGYDQGVYWAMSEQYTVSGWDELIYQELKEGRPLVYAGSSTGGGHAYVVDGYEVQEGSGYYHVNWGWNGGGNGFYKINLLNPNMSGAGGSTTKDGYCLIQRALIGLQPAQSAPDHYGRYLSSFSWNEYVEGYPRYNVVINTSHNPGTFTVAMAERNADGTIDYSRLHSEQTKQMPGYSYAGYVNRTASGFDVLFFPENMTDGLTTGRHELVFVNKEADTDAPWRPLFGPNCYVEINVDDEGHPTDTIYHPQPQLTANSRYFVLSGLKQRGVRHTVTAKITNNSDDDYIGSVYFCIYAVDGNTLQYQTSYAQPCVMMEAHGTAELDIDCSFPNSGQYVMLLTRSTELLTGCKVSNLKNKEGYICHKSVTIGELEFSCQDVAYSVNTDNPYDDPSTFDFLIYNGTTQDYNSMLGLKLFKRNAEEYYDEYIFPGGISTFLGSMTVGAKAQQHVRVGLPGVLEAGDYALKLYMANDFWSTNLRDFFVFASGPYTITDATGIKNTVSGRSATDGEVYDLWGRKMSNASLLNKGLYIQNGKKVLVK